MQDMEVCYTLIGHSERRSKYGETDEDTATKVEKCQAAGLKVLFCIGDLLEEREAGKTDEVNKRQLLSPKSRTGMTSSLPDPVVASVGIGTGKVAIPGRGDLRWPRLHRGSAEAAKIRMGGSVMQKRKLRTARSIKELIAKSNIDGFLVASFIFQGDRHRCAGMSLGASKMIQNGGFFFLLCSLEWHV